MCHLCRLCWLCFQGALRVSSVLAVLAVLAVLPRGSACVTCASKGSACDTCVLTFHRSPLGHRGLAHTVHAPVLVHPSFSSCPCGYPYPWALLQASQELGKEWTLMRAGTPGCPDVSDEGHVPLNHCLLYPPDAQ